MKDVLLLANVTVTAVFGFFLMSEIDNFLDKNKKAIKGERNNDYKKMRKRCRKSKNIRTDEKEVHISGKTDNK